MPQYVKNSFRDTRVAAVNEEFDRETNIYALNSGSFESKGEDRVDEPIHPRSAEGKEMWRCQGCSVDTYEIDEYYMVQFHIWQSVVPVAYQEDLLCIGCLEGYLGRQLVSEDFIEAPVNYTLDKSERLLNRMGQWFRDFDGPFASDEERWAAVEELGNRMDGLVNRNV